ncbi:14604_t:CDS:2, partial [Cetraspora pellucida]
VWGYCLDICGGQPNNSLDIQRLMGLGTFIVTIALSIPLDSVVIGGSPLRVLIECFNMLRKKHISITISYLIILMAYILSFGIGAYTISNLRVPYIIETKSFKWVQAPTVLTKKLNDSMNDAFVGDNVFAPYSGVQLNALSSWVKKAKTGIKEIAFMPLAFSTKGFETNISTTNQVYNDYLVRWRRENAYENVGMQYLASQCNIDLDFPCRINSSKYIRVIAGKENQTISWRLCNLEYDSINTTTSMQINCNITIKGGTFPLVILEYPDYDLQPREEYLSQVLDRKDKLSELKEIKDNLFNIMEEALLRPLNNYDLFTTNVAMQLISTWNCEPGNVACAQSKGELATIRYVGAILETTYFMYFANNFNDIAEWTNNSSSTGFFRISHRVCLGGSNPMKSIGLMIAIPMMMTIIGLLPLLSSNKLVWLAADIANSYVSFIRTYFKGNSDSEAFKENSDSEAFKEQMIKIHHDPE